MPDTRKRKASEAPTALRAPQEKQPSMPPTPPSPPQPAPAQTQAPPSKGNFPSIPTPTLASYNLNGLSAEAVSGDSLERQTRVVANLEALGGAADIICTQESRAGLKARIYRRLLRAQFKVFRNPNPDSTQSGGMDVFVRKTLAEHYDITHTIVLTGFVHVLQFSPNDSKEPPYSSPFMVINVYLPSGKPKLIKSIFTALSERFPKAPRYVLAAGDWNLTENASDSSSKDHFASSPSMRSALANILKHFKLQEVYQPLHTRVQGEHSSRLDRAYVSHPVVERCLMSPEVTLPWHPHAPGIGKDKGPSDHFPILLSFSSPQLEKHARFKIPEWLAALPELLDVIRERWATRPCRSPNPVKRWLAFKRIIRTEAIGFMRKRNAEVKTKAASLSD